MVIGELTNGKSGKSRLCDCSKDFMPWLPQSSQTVPHRGRSLSRRLKSGFCACTDCSVRTYTYVRSCTRIYAHTSNCVPTSQIFSPMSRCRHFMSRCPTDAVNCVLLMHCIVERNVYPTIVQQQPCLTSLMALWWIGSMPYCIFLPDNFIANCHHSYDTWHPKISMVCRSYNDDLCKINWHSWKFNGNFIFWPWLVHQSKDQKDIVSKRVDGRNEKGEIVHEIIWKVWIVNTLMIYDTRYCLTFWKSKNRKENWFCPCLSNKHVLESFSAFYSDHGMFNHSVKRILCQREKVAGGVK